MPGAHVSEQLGRGWQSQNGGFSRPPPETDTGRRVLGRRPSDDSRHLRGKYRQVGRLHLPL